MRGFFRSHAMTSGAVGRRVVEHHVPFAARILAPYKLHEAEEIRGGVGLAASVSALAGCDIERRVQIEDPVPVVVRILRCPALPQR
jgi:hypothetical protein